uniref:DUF5641 domain-containing protein n=1 Tax=Strigamia maritima TaxID=126957 RepID=T1IL24_STRMM
MKSSCYSNWLKRACADGWIAVRDDSWPAGNVNHTGKSTKQGGLARQKRRAEAVPYFRPPPPAKTPAQIALAEVKAKNKDKYDACLKAKKERKEIRAKICAQVLGYPIFFTDNDITWSFIAPLAPNWGGVWERLVKSLKEKLRRVLRHEIVTFEVLDIHCKEIASIVNSRPLIYGTESRDNEFALTREHFLSAGIYSYQDHPHKSEVKICAAWKELVARTWLLFGIRGVSYLAQLRNFHESRETETDSPLKIGSVVLVERTSYNPYFWLLGRVQKLYPGRDGVVRAVELTMGDGSMLVRSVMRFLTQMRSHCSNDVVPFCILPKC